MTYKFIFTVLFLISGVNYSQYRGSNLFDEFGETARTYLLSANRPGFSTSTNISTKGRGYVDLSFSYSGGYVTLPLTFSYGAAKNVEVFTGMDIVTQSYTLNQTKTSGVGDAHFGVKYRFQESDKFEHAIQSVVKIPIGQKEKNLGTGFADFHFGIAQTFYYKKFSYDISFDFSLLHKRDVSNIKSTNQVVQQIIDSLKSYYNHTYEKNISLSLTPSIDLSSKSSIYAGASFNRNSTLDFNTADIYLGIGFSPNDRINISVGGSEAILNLTGFSLFFGIGVLI